MSLIRLACAGLALVALDVALTVWVLVRQARMRRASADFLEFFAWWRTTNVALARRWEVPQPVPMRTTPPAGR